jgi:hypothetical protein
MLAGIAELSSVAIDALMEKVSRRHLAGLFGSGWCVVVLTDKGNGL